MKKSKIVQASAYFCFSNEEFEKGLEKIEEELDVCLNKGYDIKGMASWLSSAPPGKRWNYSFVLVKNE